MLTCENTIKICYIIMKMNFALYESPLPYNPIVRSYDRILDLDLV